ncbi:MAG: LrgB family protein [Muribaculaceae bacterium]|nr:LrgB family protein [Muribaculaceae bacterium]
MEYLSNTYFLLALTFLVYSLSKMLQMRTGIAILNPILLSAIIIITFLELTDIDVATYNEGGRYIEFWLKPAVVALGVPLYKQLSNIKKQMMPLLVSELAGCVVGIISVVLVARLLGATQEVVMSLAAKSVTTPIAMEVTRTLGGIPSLTAAVVVCVGIFGGLTGFRVMKVTHIGSPIAQGLSLGTAAHAMGTSRAMDVSDKYGAFASLGLTLNGVFTALLTPTILEIIDAIF